MAAWLILAVLAFIGLTVVAVRWAPEWLATETVRKDVPQAQEIGRVRSATLAMLAGAIATVGAVFTGLAWTLNRKGQLNERFSRAIDQLGHEEIDVRVGAIYTLEGVARDSPRVHHRPITEILTAYVRNRAEWEPDPEKRKNPAKGWPRPSADVQAALTVLGDRAYQHDDPRRALRLSGTDLRGANLRGGHFERARFRNAHLEGVLFEGANLVGAKFRDAHLERADFAADSEFGLPAATLQDAEFRGASYDRETKWPPRFDAEAACDPPPNGD